jgi:hypothetical protein
VVGVVRPADARPRASRRWATVAALLILLAACADQLAAPTEPLRLLQPVWSEAYEGEAFEGALRPTGGLRPYRFEVIDGSLPPGLRLEGGRLLGTPTEVGVYRFMLTVTDGNLAQALQEMNLRVLDLPTPVITVESPATEVRDPLRLVARLENARGWRGAQVAVRWDAARFELQGDVEAADPRMVVFSRHAPGELDLAIAALGEPRDGASALARWTLVPLEPPARVTLDVTATSRYAGGSFRAERREGSLAGPTQTPTAPNDGPLDVDLDEPANAVPDPLPQEPATPDPEAPDPEAPDPESLDPEAGSS